ncbi:hypothetical protein PZC41_14350 [Staphylococcus aureus]|uniref:hypothetical protein n=1 Tax=Staphylococcus aureus TaxID=1280 RepID=UPI0023B1BB5D|nr:hypothetical protein [Staphylococcus aureus]MDE8535485.1 hypothetical protein [Staphylococcus aureus]
MARKQKNQQQVEQWPEGTATIPYAEQYRIEGVVGQDRHGLHVSVGGVVYYLPVTAMGSKKPIVELYTLYRPDRSIGNAHLRLADVGVHNTNGSRCSCAITLMTGQPCSDIKNYPEAKRLFEQYLLALDMEREAKEPDEPEPV